MKAVFAEFVGTFLFVLTAALCVSEPGAGPLAPLAIGAMYAAMVYAVGRVSGGHFNPAISLAAAFRKSLLWRRLIPYWLGQLLGALLAAGAVLIVKGGVSIQPMTPRAGSAFVAELIFTFALCYVVLHVSTARTPKDNSYFGLAAGLVLLAAGFAIGDLSGAILNPALALGLCGLNLLAFSSLWIYLLAGFVSAVLAATFFLFVNGRHLPDGLP